MDNSDIQKFQEDLNKSLIDNTPTEHYKKMLNSITDLAQFSVFNYESGGKQLNKFRATEKVGDYTVEIVTTVIEKQECDNA